MKHAEKFLKENMLPDEKVLWTGRPTNVKTFEKPYTLGYIIRFVIGVLCIVFAIWYWTYAMAKDLGTSLPVTMTIIMVAIAAFLFITPFTLPARLAKRAMYAITNQRAMIIYNVNPAVARQRELSAVMGSSWETLSTGNGVIYIGEKTKEAPRKSRDLSLVVDMPDNELPLMFYSVENPAAVFATLTKVEVGDDVDEATTIA